MISYSRIIICFCFLMGVTLCHAQSLGIDFETDISTSDFVDFDGGTAIVIDNPQSNGINTSGKIAQIVRDGGQIWAGSKIPLTSNLDFSTDSSISMKVFMTAPAGTTVKFKLENGSGNSVERDATTTLSGAWEILTWDFTAVPSDFNELVFMFDFGNTGDGGQNSTFLFDDIQQIFAGAQIDLPLDFEGDDINYTTTDFGGNVSALAADPTDATNTVVKVIKPDQAATWAGTTIGTPSGFATNIPLTLDDSKMYVRVWSPEAGTPIRLKVEDSNDPTHTCETETNTSLEGEWEVIEFDFVNQAPGTELLSVGLSMGWTYNMASIFFNFGTDGATAGEKTYYFDEVQFGSYTSATSRPEIEGLQVFPNPSNQQWTISSPIEPIKQLQIYDVQGRLLSKYSIRQSLIHLDTNAYVKGVYFCKISNSSATSIVKLIRK